MNATTSKRLYPDDTSISYADIGVCKAVMAAEWKGKRKGFIIYDSTGSLTYGDDLWSVRVGTVGDLRKAINDYDRALDW